MKTMKKYIFALIATMFLPLSMMAQNVAKIGDTEYATLAEAVTAATAGQTIELINDVTLTSTVSINKGITIDGGGHSVSSSSANPFTLSGFDTSETNSVTFNNVKINATGSNARGIVVNQFAGTLTLTGCTLTVAQRGITYGESNKNIDLVISNTTIQNCSVSDPTTQYTNNDSRGLSIWTTNNTPNNTVTLTNTIIKGFAYCINVAGGGTGGTEVTMNGGATYGRAAINNWNKNNTFTLTGVDIHGLNNQTGPTERFACIVDYVNADNNVYNITDCTFTATLSDAAITAGGNAAQLMFALRGQNSVANIHGNTTYSSTCPDESRVGLIELESQLVPSAEGGLNNKFVFDADAQQSLAEEIAKTSITVDSEGNGTTSYVAQVVNGAIIKRYTTLPAAFAPTAATDGCTITLLKDITLSDDITCQLTNGNSFYLKLNGHSLSRDANAQVPTYIYLNEGVTVYTDVEIDGLLLGLNNCPIVKSANADATYKYKYTVVADDYVAHINGALYTSLANAVAAAQTGDVITMIADDNTSLTSGQEITIDKSITITGPVDSDGIPLCIINGTDDNSGYNDLFIKCTTGTVTISNVGINGFGNTIASKIGHAPITVSSQNNKVVLDNVWISNINCEGVHINGGEFEITNCNIDASKATGYSDFTKGICVANAATGSITGTTIDGVVCEMTNSITAGIELQGQGPVTIDGCTITASGNGAAGIAANSAEDLQPGASTATVSNSTVTSDYLSLYGDGEKGALISVTSGTYNGTLLAVAGTDSQGLSISGGTFDNAVPAAYCAPGYVPAGLADGKYSVAEENDVVAKIGTTSYTSLDAAFATVQDGETITMLKDVTLSDKLILDLTPKSVTLDLGTHTLTGRTNLTSGNLTIKNGTVAGGDQQALNVYGSADSSAENYSVLNINSDVTVTGDQFGVCMFGATAGTNGYGAVINIAGTVHTVGTGAEGAVFVSGNLGNNITGDQNNVINITGTVKSDKDAGVALNGNATVNVENGAFIEGNTAIAIKRGKLNVTGGTVHSTGLNNIPPSGNLSGTEMTGAAVSMTNTYNNLGAMEVNISGGSFTSDHAMALYKEEDTYQNGAKYSVSGGIFNTPVPAEFCATGYTPTSITTQGHTQYTVEASGQYTAQIGETRYTTLAAAIAAVPEDGTKTTIKMIANETVAENTTMTIAATKNIVLDLNGKTITGSSTTASPNFYFITNKGTLEVTDNTESASGKITFGCTAATYSNEYVTICNEGGTFTLTNGTVENTSGGLSYAVNSRSVWQAEEATFNLNGGTISAPNGDAALRVYQSAGTGTPYKDIVNISGGTILDNGIFVDEYISSNLPADYDGSNVKVEINITGGTVNGLIDFKMRHPYGTSLNITGGEFGNAKLWVRKYTSEYKTGDVEPTAPIVHISDGKFSFVPDKAFGLAYDCGTSEWSSYTQPYEVSGGVFNVDLNSYPAIQFPTGQTCVLNTDPATKDAYPYRVGIDAVAKIGSTIYSSLEDAIAAVQNGETIVMLKDVTLSNPLDINIGTKSITLDLGGKTLTGRTNLKRGNVTIMNGKVVGGAQQALNVYGSATPATNYSVLNINADVEVTADQFGVCLFGPTFNSKPGYGAVINIAGTVHTQGNGAEGAVFVSGNLGNNITGDQKNVINISGKVTSDTDAGVALNGNATVNVLDGAEITGNTAIAVKRGTLNVTGGTVHSTGEEYIPTGENHNGTEMTGAGISMTNTYNQYGPMAVNITGGTITSDHSKALYKQEGNYTNDATFQVSGGFFSSVVPAEFCAPSYAPVTTPDAAGLYTVTSPVARIGSTGYATLQDAINAAVTSSITSGNEVTVELLTDVTDGTGLALFNNATGSYPAANGANVKIDFGGHKYTVAGPAVGSSNTVNQALHFEQGNTVTLTNGTINMTNDATALGAFEMFMQNYGTLTIDKMNLDGTGIAVATYASSYGTPWGGTTKPQFNYNTAGNSVIRNSTITMPGDMGIDDAAALTIEDDAVINVNKIVTKGTDERYESATATITVENGAKFKLTNADGAGAFDLLLAAQGQTLGTPDANGVYTVGVLPIAKIGSTIYSSLADAFAAVQNGETIVMLQDVTLSEALDINIGTKAVTLDLGGKTLTGRTNLKQGNVTIMNGKVVGGDQQALNVYGSATPASNYSVLNINPDVEVTADQFGVCLFGPTFNSKPGYGAVINIAGTVHTQGNGAEGAVFVSGNLGNNITGDQNNVINITGTVISDTDAGVALNGNATVNVKSGASITGNTAIAVKRGVLNVEDGATVHGTGASNIPPVLNNNGTEMTGAAVSMTNTYNQYGSMAVNITGGTFKSDNAVALYKEADSYTNDATFQVSGGLFSSVVPAELCAPDCAPVTTPDANGYYTVTSPVARIGSVNYATLADAVAAVPTDGTATTIVLLKDITLTDNIVVGGTYDGSPKKTKTVTNQNVTLNLNNHNITGEKTIYLAGGSLNITGSGIIESTSEDVAPVGVRFVKTSTYPNLDYTSKRTLTIGNYVMLRGAQYGLNVFGTNEGTTANNIEVNVNGQVQGMLFVLGNLKNDANNIVINVKGTVDASGATGSEKVKTGIALSGNAKVNVQYGAVVKGESGIEVRAGELNVNGGAITGVASYGYDANGDGMTTKGAAIAVAQHNTNLKTTVNVNGGTLNAEKLIAVTNTNNDMTKVLVTANQNYVVNTETVVPDGYGWISNGDGTYTLKKAAAMVDNQAYETFADAVTAAGNEKIITLLADIEDPYTLSEGQLLQVIKNGHTITVKGPNGTDDEVFTEVVTVGGKEVTIYMLRTNISDLVEGTLRSDWTGHEQSVPLVITYGNLTLVKGTDYKLQKKNETTGNYEDVGDITKTEVGPVTFKVVGIGKFYGEKEVTWTIYKNINNDPIRVEVDPAIYTNADIDPDDYVHVYDGTTELVNPTDYTVEVSTTLKGAKTYVNAVTVKGTEAAEKYIGGEVTFSLDVEPEILSDFFVMATAPYVTAGYGANNAASGAAVKAAATIVIKDANGKVWTNYEGFEVTIDNDPTSANNNYNNTGTYPGVVHVTVKDDYKKNFIGTIPAGDLTIGDGIDISKSLVVSTSSAIYTSTQLPPSKLRMTVKLGNTELVHGTDYTYTIHGKASDFVDAKTYSNAVTITGIGKYYGSFDADYTIYQRDLSNKYVHCEADQPIVWKSSNIKLNVNNIYQEEYPDLANHVNLYLLVNENRYNLAFADYTWESDRDLKDPGEYTITFIGRGNFTGHTQVKVMVLKDISEIVAGIDVPLQVIPNNNSLKPSTLKDIVVKDGNQTLEPGIHYTIAVTSEDGNTTYDASNLIKDDGIYKAIIQGKQPYYSGSETKVMPVLFEYNHFDASKDGTSYYNGNSSGYQIVQPVSIHVTSGKNLECTVGDKNMPAVATDVASATLPGEAKFTFGNNTYTLKVVGIDNNAFDGAADEMRYLDATALTDYAPSTLTRDFDGPFNGLPKQTLVFLCGTNFTGENYIYKYGSGDTDFRCDELKIYEDLNGNQQGYSETGGYKWGFENPYEFKANTVTNTRQLNASNAQGKQQGYTICLPYALPASGDFTAYTLAASKQDLLGFVPVETTPLAAMTPYVLLPNTSGQLLSATSVMVKKTVGEEPASVTSAAVSGQTEYIMKGTMTYLTDKVGAYIMQNGNVWKKIQAAAEYGGPCILPMRAYIEASGSGAPQLMSVFGAEGTTGMDVLERVDLDAEDGQYFDLQGRPVETPTRGVYIRNGKKVVIK